MGERTEERQLLKELPEGVEEELMFLHLRDMWAVDGLYYLGIEERFGTEAATEIDAFVWRVMGKIEARKLKKLLQLEGSDLEKMIRALKFSGWAMDLEDKEWEHHDDHVILRNVECRVQNTRKKDGLDVFPCKVVRFDFLRSFAKEFSEDIEVRCNQCPPDDLKGDFWCEWLFRMRD